MKNDVDPMTVQGLLKMIQKYEKTDSFDVQSDRLRKRINSTVVEEVATAVQKSSGCVKPCSTLGIARTLNNPVSVMHKILQNILHCYPFKISHMQEFPSDLPARETLVLEFLACMEVNKEGPWTILWIDETHFRLAGYVNTQNCRIWATENPLETQPVPLHPALCAAGLRHHLS